MPNKTLNLEPISLRIAIVIAGAIVVMLLLLFSVRFLGDTLASTSDVPELVELAKTMSPGNPKPYLTTSSLWEASFKDEDLKSALNDAETAVMYSPDDYFIWQTIARLRERSGDIKGAEIALRRALQLAPNHAAVQWAMGNLLLRQDKNEEAFKLIRSAAESDKKYAGPAASIAWDIYDGDMAQVRSAIGESSQVKTALAVYLSKQKRYEAGVEIWKSLSKQERGQVYSKEGRALLTTLVSGKRFLSAAEVAVDLQTEDRPAPKIGRITNGGFETYIATEKIEFYEWLIAAGDVPSIGVSVEEKRSGAKSLAVFFEGVMGNEFRPVSQTIAVRGGETYSLTVHYKAELISDATVIWQIADTAGGGILASTAPISAQSDWNSVDVSFTVPEDSEGVVVRLARASCAKLRCPIRGTVWFDDIEVK